MPDPCPPALAFLLARRSQPAKTLRGPVPGRAALDPVLRAGLRSPDHGALEPWRLIVLERPALTRLADLVRRCGPEARRPPEEIDKQQMSYREAGLVIAVVFAPVESAKIPEEEQLLSAGAVCMQILNAALAAGWGASWVTGWASRNRVFVSEGLGLQDHERIAGLIHVGTGTAAPVDRPRPNSARKITWLAE